MKLGRNRKPPEPHIPFISLADIAWQIIIFFLIAATFATHTSMNVDLPSSNNNKDASSPTKTITIQAGNSALMLNGEAVNLADLTPKLQKLLSTAKSEQDKAVMVLGRSDLTFQRHADVMYAVQKAGGILILSEEK